MTQETDFFDNIGGGSGAPSPHLKNVGDSVRGEIVDMFKRDFIPFGKKEPEQREDGSNKQQLVITLQTQHRNWENVTKVPDVDPNDPSKGQKTPDQDDGKRSLYVPEGKNIQFAIGRAASAAKQRLAVGGQLAVRIFNLKPTDFGNELKEHEAIYTPPALGGDAFGGPAPQAQTQPQHPSQAQVQQAPAQQAYAQGSSFGGGDHGMNPPAQVQQAQQAVQPAAPAQAAPPAQPAPSQDPWATPAPAATPGDPWATPAQAGTNGPPF